jgi:hypothetical protein
MDKLSDFEQMHAFALSLIQSNMSRDIRLGEEWKADGQALAIKFFKHLNIVRTLHQGTTFTHQGAYFDYVDHSTMAVVTRSAVENYLTLKYIFINDNSAVSVFRHKTWRLAGLIDRSKIYANSDINKAILAAERLQINILLKDIKLDPQFSMINSKHKKSIQEGKWKPKDGWSALGSENMHQVFFNDIYNHLSGHTHSSYISALQTRCADNITDQRMLAEAMIIISCQLLAHFITNYSKLFTETETLQPDDALSETIDAWHVTMAHTRHIYDAGLSNPYSKSGFLGDEIN